MPCPQSTARRWPATLPQYLRRRCPSAHPDPSNRPRSWQLRWPCSSSKNCRSNCTPTIGGYPNGRSGAGGSEGQLLLDKNLNFAYLTLHREGCGWIAEVLADGWTLLLTTR